MPIDIVTPSPSGPTLAEIVTEVVTMAQGFAVAPDLPLALDADITASDVSITITGAMAPGVYEIDDELVRVTAVDQNTGACTVHPSGRGWQGTAATAHSAGALVTQNPAFPRARAAAAVNDAISSLYPEVFGVGLLEATATTVWTIELPDEAEGVLDVRLLNATSAQWERVRRWELENQAADTTTGRAVLVPGTTSGDSLLVVYSIRPQRLTADQQWSETGLDLALKEVVQLGALARLAQYIDIARFTDRASSPKGDVQQPQGGMGFQMSRSLMADFKERKNSEAVALRYRFPARQHFTR